MNKLTLILVFFTVSVFSQSFAQVSLIWENDTIAYTPESIVYDEMRNYCYVSNFNKSNGNGTSYNEDYITKFSLKGEVLEKEMIPNLSAPTGLSIYNDKLYIVERFGIVKYDLKQKKIERRYRISTTSFLNDVAVDLDENIYVTVSDTNIIYRIRNGEVEKWLENDLIFNPNAIMFDENKIIVGACRDNAVRAITLNNKEISTIAKIGPEFGVIDGLNKYKNGYIISHFDGTIYTIDGNGKVDEILNTTKEGTTCADFEFIENQGLIISPDLNNSKVQLYKLE